MFTPISCARQIYEFIEMAFEEGRGLFVPSPVADDGVMRYNLREGPVEDEEQHCELLRVVGLFIGKSMRWAYPIGIALHDSFYSCLKNQGMHPDGPGKLSDMMRGRIKAFVGGIFEVISPLAFHHLSELEIGLLFEWRLSLGVETIRQRHLEPPMEPESLGAKLLGAFCDAIESFPVLTKNYLLRYLSGEVQIKTPKLLPPPKLSCGLRLEPTRDGLFSLDHENHQIVIPIVNPRSATRSYRTRLFLSIRGKERISTRRLIVRAGMSLEERLEAARLLTIQEDQHIKLQLPRENLFGMAYGVYLQRPAIRKGLPLSNSFINGLI